MDDLLQVELLSGICYSAFVQILNLKAVSLVQSLRCDVASILEHDLVVAVIVEQSVNCCERAAHISWIWHELQRWIECYPERLEEIGLAGAIFTKHDGFFGKIHFEIDQVPKVFDFYS